MSDTARLDAPASDVPPPPLPRGGFRADIQGMRALAVGAVLLFHTGIKGITGGYVGVDLFFVLSGYLIIGLLIREAETSGSVNFLQFYARRLKRLAPTYLVVLGTVLAAIMAFLSPLQQYLYLPEVSWAALYVANIFFARQEQGYFANAEPPPLMHFWSLAVEEQFYLVAPALLLLVLVLSRKRFRRTILWVLVAVTVISFGLSVALTPLYAKESYYLLPTRAWQLSVGGVLAALPASLYSRLGRRARVAMLLGGLALLLAACVAFTPATPFPGWAAAVPVLASVLMIASGTEGRAPLARTLLENRPMVYLGNISYSLYLWHWPILVLPQLALGHPVRLRYRLLLMLASVAVAALNYHFLENPLRHLSISRHLRKIYAVSLSLTVALALAAWGLTARADAALTSPSSGRVPPIGYTTVLKKLPQEYRERYANDRLSADGTIIPAQRLTPALPKVERERGELYDRGCNDFGDDPAATRCDFGDTNAKRTVVLFGDSLAGQWFAPLKEVADKEHLHLVTFVKTACPSVLLHVTEVSGSKEPFLCTEWQQSAWDQIRQMKPNLVILSNSQRGYAGVGDIPTGAGYNQKWLEAVRDTMAQVPKGTKTLMVNANVGQAPSPNICFSKNIQNPDACALSRTIATGDATARLQNRLVWHAGGDVLDVPVLMCEVHSCPVVVGNVLVYRDPVHLTPAFTSLFAPYWAYRIDRLVPPR